MDDINSSIPFYLNALSDTVRLRVNRELEACGITWKQLFVLMNCELQAEDVSLADIQGALKTDPGALTRLIARLEDKCWIVTAADPTDHRKVLIRLTPSGRKILSQAKPVRAKALEEIFQVLCDTEQRELSTLLEKFYNALMNPESR